MYCQVLSGCNRNHRIQPGTAADDYGYGPAGTEMCIRDRDTFNRSEGSRKAIGGAKLLQGTFMNRAEYEGLDVSVYKDEIPDSGTDLFYSEKVAEVSLPAGYRSFAVTVDKNQPYLVQGGDQWFSMDVDQAKEDYSVEGAVHTAHYATGDVRLSDNCWLYVRAVSYTHLEIKVNKRLYGKTIRELHLEKYDLNLIALEKEPNITLPGASPDEVLTEDDAILVIGKFADADRFERKVMNRG